MYADRMTGSMDRAIKETNRRREIQDKYNVKHNITPTSIIKGVRDVIEATKVAEEKEKYSSKGNKITDMSAYIIDLEKEMRLAADNLDFEKAAKLRDEIKELKTIKF